MRRMATGAVMAVLTAGPLFGQLIPLPFPTGPAVLKPAPIDVLRVKQLVGQLGADDYRAREKAGKALLALGDRALPALKDALQSADDAEVSRRLQVIIKRLDEERFGRGRRVTLKVSRKPVKAVLAELARQSGYVLQYNGGDEKAVYTFDLADVPFWQALDQICDTAGLSAQQQDDDGTVQVVPNDSYSPYVCYHGPFKVVATNINSGRNIPLAGLNRRQPAGRPPEFLNLNLTVQAEPMAPLVGVGAAVVEKAVDDRGQSLLPPANPTDDPTSVSLYSPVVAYRSYSQGLAVTLARGDRSAMAIREVRGKVPVAVLADTKPELVIDNLLAAKKRRFAGGSVDVEVAAVDYQNDNLSLELTVRKRTGDPEDYAWVNTVTQRLEVLDADGRKYQFNGLSNQNTGPGIVALTAQFAHPNGKPLGKPARLQVVAWVTVTKEVEFSFKDIPLP